MHTNCEFAGLGDVNRPGLTVKETAECLRRFAYVERRLMFIQAGFVVTVPERNFKVWLGRLQYQAGKRADALKKRLPELRTPKVKAEAVPHEGLAIWLDELSHAPTTTLKWVSLQSVYEKLLRAYRRYLNVTNPLADAATVEILEPAIVQLERICQIFADERKAQESPEDASEFIAALDLYVQAAGGLDGTKPTGKLPKRIRSDQPLEIPHKIERDDTFKRVWDYVAPPQSEVARHLAYIIGLRLSEVNVAEGLGLVLNETPGKPWEFYFDLSRHLWDEIRHSLMGEAAMTTTLGDRRQIPMRDYEGVYCMEAPPLEQYATLGLEIEGANMKYPVGKRGEWEFCRDTAQHALMTLFQDYDWADEVVHVNIARAQLSHWFEGGTAALSEFAAKGKTNRTNVKKRHAPELLPVLEKLIPPEPASLTNL